MRHVHFLVLALACSGLRGQAPPPSFIAAPIRVDLGPLLAAAERATPQVPPGVETWINLPGSALSSPAYRFNLYRETLAVTLKGNRLGLATTVNYWMEVGLRMKGWVKGMGSCGRAPEAFRRARLALSAEVAVTPEWGLDLKITPQEPQRLDGCEVTFLGYDITDKVLGGMKDALVKAAQAMEQQLKASPLLRQRAEAVWLQAQQPVELSPGVFMLLNPERVRLAPWTSLGRELTLTPELQVRPSLTLGQRPLVEPRPLPPLDASTAPIQPGFHLQVEADLPFEHASAQLARQVVGKRFETPKGTFEIRKLALHGQDGYVYLDIELKGRVDGNLTLKGRPVFDEKTGQLHLADLDYTLESKSWITQFGEWLYRSDLRKTLAEKGNWFLDENFKTLRTQAQQGLNRALSPELAMTGTIDTLTLKQVEVLGDRLRVGAELAGQVQIAVRMVP
jgi:hypothetical protein